MELLELAEILDAEFRIASHPENLVEWAVTESNRPYVFPDFTSRKTGLMLQGSDEIVEVIAAVFVTDTVVQKVSSKPQSLLFTHHHFDYYEDPRGLQPIRQDTLRRLVENRISIYVCHAPLDTHPVYGTSRALAEAVHIPVDSSFYDYYGAPVAVSGRIPRTPFRLFSEQTQRSLQRPFLTLVENQPYVERVAVVAGCGDIPALLEEAYELQCDTLITGSVEQRWAIPSFQESNRRFHSRNQELRMNLIGGTHFGTERPAMIGAVALFDALGIPCSYCEDEVLLNAT